MNIQCYSKHEFFYVENLQKYKPPEEVDRGCVDYYVEFFSTFVSRNQSKVAELSNSHFAQEGFFFVL